MGVKHFFWLALVLVSLAIWPAAGLGAGTTIIYGSTDTSNSFDPPNAPSIHGIEILYNIQGMLFTYKTGTMEVVPDLVESYTVNDKGDEYVFKLKEGIKFDDGTPFDASVVVHSIDRSFKLKGDYSWLAERFIASMEILGPYEVKIVLTGPWAFFPAVLTDTPFAMVNPNIFPVDKHVNQPDEAPGGVVHGLGPYKVVSFKRDEELVLEARPNYHGAKPKNDRIVIRYFADATTMRLALEKGEADVIGRTLNIPDIIDLRDSGKYNYYDVSAPFIRFLSFLCTDPPFDSKVVRQGVAVCINRAEIIKKVHQGLSRPLYSMLSQDWWPYLPAFETTYGDGNVAKGKELLAQAGYNENNKLNFELWYAPSGLSGEETEFATMIKSQLEATGVMEVSTRAVEFASFMDGIGKKSAQACLIGMMPDYPDVDMFWGIWTNAGFQVLFGSHYANEELEAVATEAAGELDLDKRAALYNQISKAWAMEVPNAPIVELGTFAFSAKNVTGLTFSPAGCLFYKNIEMTE